MLKVRAKNNRTARYLSPTLSLFGKTFLKEVKLLTDYISSEIGQSVIQYSIMDLLYYRAKRIDRCKEYLFITIDKKGAYNKDKDMYINKQMGTQRFLGFINYVRKHSHYVDDYWNSNGTHVLVMKIPMKISYQNFLISKYSQMYSLSELKELGFSPFIYEKGEKYRSADYIVLSKSNDFGKTILKSVVYENYGVNDIAEEPEEFDIPWLLQDEILNWNYLTEFEKEQVQKMKKRENYVLQN